MVTRAAHQTDAHATDSEWAAIASADNPDVLVVLASDFSVLWVSASVERIYGYRPADLIGRPAHTLLHPDDVEYAVGALIEADRRDGSHLPTQIRIVDACGASRLTEIATHTGQNMVLSLRDIAQREVLPVKRRELEKLVQRLSNRAASAPRGGLERVVIGCLADLGYFLAADAVIFSSVDVDRSEVRLEHEWVRPDSRSARTYRPIISTDDLLWDPLSPPERGYLFVPDLAALAASEPRAARLVEVGLGAVLDVPVLDGGRLIAVVSARWTGDGYGFDDATASLVCIAAEITTSVVQRMGTERRLETQATRDGLTGLPNRVKLAEVLHETLACAEAEATSPAVLFCDLDGFKEVNDRCGHSFGDRVLAEVARRIEQSVMDVAFIARVGGDEFVVVVPTGVVADLDDLSMRVRNAVLSLRVVEGVDIDLDVSIGHAHWIPGDTPEELLRRADASMYEQKGNRK
jgi:diguanylate cyclase (GGDEF)-like protein/PAS domain S-box-containing protein